MEHTENQKKARRKVEREKGKEEKRRGVEEKSKEKRTPGQNHYDSRIVHTRILLPSYLIFSLQNFLLLSFDFFSSYPDFYS